MGIYADKVLPRVIDKLLDNDDIAALRRRAIEGLSGVVLEIGFGSGLNVPLYPAAVTKVLAVDPALLGRRLAATRVAQSSIPVEYVGLDGQKIDLPDECADNALSTFTLCTIPDEERALREVFRVLRPGGRLHFVEHGLAPDDKTVKWQRRIEPVNKRLAGGCHLSRPHDEALLSVGFEVEQLQKEYGHGPKPYTFHYIGVARKPSRP